MNTILTILLGLVLLAVVGALVVGLITLLRGGEFSQKYSNEAMRWRVILQAIALFIFFLLLLYSN